jgi:hypothetical protein
MRYCVSWSDRPLIKDETTKELILALSMKILSTADPQLLLVLERKSTV